MKLTIEINTENAAFDDNENELMEIFEKIQEKLDQGNMKGKVLDSNGNSVANYNCK